MFYRMFVLSTLAVTICVASIALAATDAKDTQEVTHDGKVVSISNNTLVTMNTEGREHSDTLAKDGKVTCDGNACKTSDLKAGMKVRVTTTKDDQSVATEVEAIDKNPLFANTHDGKIVSIANDKLVMTNNPGREPLMLTVHGNVTCDGKACKASDLKAGMTIRATTKKNDKNVAIRIEAIDKAADFSRD